MMLNGKIEKNVPFPSQHGITSTFHKELISYLDRLEIGDSVVLQAEKTEGNTTSAYKLDTKIRVPIKVYSIITGKTFTMKLDIEGNTVRIWRTG